jgi:hypothetical protein
MYQISFMGEKRFCVNCNKDVEIEKVIPHEDYDEQILSCGHTGRRKNRSLPPENVSLGEKLEANVIKFRTLTEGPILVSDNSGTSIASGSIQGIVIGRDLNAGSITFNNNTYNCVINNSSDIDNINTSLAVNHINIQNIFSMVDSNNSYSTEEKEQIKGEVSQADKLVKSLGKVSDKALPYVQLLISLIHKSG